jgi:hypothetical protein
VLYFLEKCLFLARTKKSMAKLFEEKLKWELLQIINYCENSGYLEYFSGTSRKTMLGHCNRGVQSQCL